jgi:hypothetical protein
MGAACGCGKQAHAEIKVTYKPMGGNDPLEMKVGWSSSLDSIRDKVRKEWADFRCREFEIRSAQAHLIDSDARLKQILSTVTAGHGVTLVAAPVKPNTFDDTDHLHICKYVVKLLNKDHEVVGCGYILTPNLILTSMDLIKDESSAEHHKRVLYYFDPDKSEKMAEVKIDGVRLLSPKSNAVVVQLSDQIHKINAVYMDNLSKV